MKKLLLLGYCFGVSASAQYALSQTEHSGIIQTFEITGANAVKLHCDDLLSDEDGEKVKLLFANQSGIYDVKTDVQDHKIIVKFSNDISLNAILGILEHKNFKAFYLQNGQPVYYIKSDNENF